MSQGSQLHFWPTGSIGLVVGYHHPNSIPVLGPENNYPNITSMRKTTVFQLPKVVGNGLIHRC